MIKPLNDYVVIEKIENVDKTSDNQFIIPEGAQDDCNLAKVIAVGQGIRSITNPESFAPMTVKEGDMVFVPKFNHRLEWKNKMYYIVKENEIYGIVHE